MNWLDVVLALILAASVVTSFRKGFSRELIGLTSVVIGLFAGSWFYGLAGSLLAPYLNSKTAANFAGFFLVFFAVVLLGSIVSLLVGRFLKFTGLSFFDRLLGAAFGLLRGALIGVAIVMGMMAFSPSDRPAKAVVESHIAPYLVDVARIAAAAAPHELKEGFRKTYAQVKDAWGKALEHRVKGLPDKKAENERKI